MMVIPVRVQIKDQNTPYFSLEMRFKSGEFVINPLKILNLKVIFSPVKPSKVTFEIYIQVLDNPKSNFSIICSENGFYEVLIFEETVEDDNDAFLNENFK
jgi:hypothetical protein